MLIVGLTLAANASTLAGRVAALPGLAIPPSSGVALPTNADSEAAIAQTVIGGPGSDLNRSTSRLSSACSAIELPARHERPNGPQSTAAKTPRPCAREDIQHTHHSRRTLAILLKEVQRKVLQLKVPAVDEKKSCRCDPSPHEGAEQCSKRGPFRKSTDTIFIFKRWAVVRGREPHRYCVQDITCPAILFH